MRKTFIAPMVRISKFLSYDVITTSGNEGTPSVKDDNYEFDKKHTISDPEDIA